jgi:hypothetical protein
MIDFQQERVRQALDSSNTVRQTARASIHFQDCNEMPPLNQNTLTDAIDVLVRHQDAARGAQLAPE